jgi:hypothetical protein
LAIGEREKYSFFETLLCIDDKQEQSKSGDSRKISQNMRNWEIPPAPPPKSWVDVAAPLFF